ncbi:MAG: acylaminoacyl-peptidase, partial [Candidatus Bathyarchaeota archaeon B63]
MSVIAEKLRIVEAIVRTPSYEVIGYTHNKLVYSSAVDGDTDLWSLDLDTFKTIRLTHGGVHSVASVRRRSPIVVYTYDVSRGRELEQVFMNEVYGDKETRLEGMRPMRILGLGFDGDAVALAASTEKMMELWLLRLDGEAEKIHEVGAMLFVTDYNDGKIVGHGILKGDPRSYEIFIYDLKRSEFKIYTPKEGSVNRNPRVRGDLILFTTTAFGDEELAVYDAAKGRLERPKFSYRDHERYKPKGYVSFDWTPDGRVWFIGKR